jgi:hypothetical protein
MHRLRPPVPGTDGADASTSGKWRHDDPPGKRCVTPHGTGSAVVDLIFSMAKREVTFFNGTAAISRL